MIRDTHSYVLQIKKDMTTIKIGDKVRFLHDMGGGVVAGFRKGGIVLVEDEDGFQIPTAMSDVVVANEDNYDTSRMVKMQNNAQKLETDGRSMRSILNSTDIDDEDIIDDDPALKEISFKKPVEERKGGNQLSVYLAFVPIDIKQVTNTEFETYIVNDSNYNIQYSYLTAEGANWNVRSVGEIEPNTKLYIEEFSQREVVNLSKVCMQIFAYKKDKSFTLKPTIDVQMRIDQVKFYKLHTFQENDFFEQKALLYPIIENDKITRSLNISTKQLKEELFAGNDKEDRQQPIKVRQGDENALVVDLHAEKLLDNTAGMSSADILNYQLEKFHKIMKENAKMQGKRIIFIHGKGEGVLRQALIHELNYRYKRCSYQDASFQEYGYGATQVTIK